MIIDDPMKADDGPSAPMRKGVLDWYNQTASSRANRPGKTLRILAMQRLHVADLTGELVEREWPCMALPAIAVETASYATGFGLSYRRPVGELLQPHWDSLEELEKIRRHNGSYIFAAQYQQNPVPVEGNIVMREWLKSYESTPARDAFQAIHVVCDPAGKAGPQNDYTAIVVAGMIGRDVHVLEVCRGHWGLRDIVIQITNLVEKWQANQVIVETTGLGEAVREELERGGGIDVRGILPKGDKQTRLMRHIGRFECGHIHLPEDACWLPDFVLEVLGFPGARYDDQLDALLLLLDDLAEHEPSEEISFAFVELGLGRRGDPFFYDRFSNRGYDH